MADLFRKGKSNFATTLVTGIGTGTSDTITLNSTAGLPTDTEITLTFNRVTSSGTVNATSLVERITGKISGATLTSYTRGADGTTEQAHNAGTVIEYIYNAKDLNDTVDGILVEHDQDGTHDKTKVTDLTTAQTLTNKTLTTPIIASIYQDAGKTKLMTLPDTASDTLVTLAATQALTNKTIGTSNLISFNSPEGYLLNGKIVPSVASNNLTVALKGLDGNDPSATNPIYVRIGDTVHTITSALSVTKNAGTNWFNAGSAELATKEIDYFVYLGYNATDGVVIGFSRIPYATQYSQFSATATNEKYCAISTITNAAAGDVYTVIGRFAATLSAGAGYTWTVPTFTSINLIQRPIFNTRRLSYAPQYTGFSTPPSMPFSYIVDGSVVTVYCDKTAGDGTAGTSNANSFHFTTPFTNGSTGIHAKNYIGRDNGTDSAVCVLNLNKGSATAIFYTSSGGGMWTTSGIKDIYMDNLQYSLI